MAQRSKIQTALKLITAQTSNVITTAQAKQHLKVDFADADENTYIDSLIVSAQRHIENYTGLVFSNVTYDFILSDFPRHGIVLPISPLKTLDSIKYYDSDNAQQTWGSSNYFYLIDEKPNRVMYVDTAPDVYEDRTDAVYIRATFGYTSPDSPPDGIMHAIKLLLTDLYENRTDTIRERFTAWKAFAYPYRVWHSTSENTI